VNVLTSRLFLVMLLLSAGACTDEREQASRLVVKSLAAAPKDKAAREAEKVLSFGRYALPDIEQELQVSPLEGKLRLLDVLERLKDREALPFLDFLARWEREEAARKRAGQVAKAIRLMTSAANHP
jgi:hypothetical protein